MSNDFDDWWDKHINSELARTNEYNQKLTLAQNKLVESSLVAVVNGIISLLEKTKEIDSQTANIMRNGVKIIDNIVRLCFGWF